MIKLIERLARGKGIQYLLDEAYKIFNNPIVMFDTDYSLIAYTNVFSDDPIWNEITTTGTFSLETQKFFAAECFTYDVANADKIVMLESKNLRYNRVLCNIFNKNKIKVANIVMMDCNGAFKQDEILAFERFANMITIEVRNDDFYIEYGEAHQSDLIKMLLDPTLDKRIYVSHIQVLYDGFKSYLYLAVVDIGTLKTQNDSLKHYIDLFRQKNKGFKYGVYSDYIIILISTNYKKLFLKRDLNSLVALFEQNNFSVGVSSCFENLYELRKHYDEAVGVIKKGLESNINQRVFICVNSDE